MELNLSVLSKQQVESSTGRKGMRLSENAQTMVFRLFTKNVYSNPIGTVVREITSNCFDSHVEAGVKNTPVLIKKWKDEQTSTTYISFFDYGVGMSPDRVENIYGVYFESTKRGNNDEIGGFGIGGKTPLAYIRSTGEGEGDYDNSFFVVTRFNGKKYYYTIFEGKSSPEYILLHEENTDEGNGTEVRIPILEKDVYSFENELKKQLFYFEGIVFEGFSDSLTNDYKIIRGKNFLMRKGCFNNYMHVCLGKVYYPIDYDILGMSQYDYEVPVAINVPIGAIGMTVNREQLDYSDKTVKYLKKAIPQVIDELKDLLTKQYRETTSLEDYFELKRDFGRLRIAKEYNISLSNFVKAEDLELKKFKYKGIFKTFPSADEMFKALFDVTRYGKKELKRGSDYIPKFDSTYNGLLSFKDSQKANIYCSEPNDLEIKRIKQSYLRSKHERFYVIVPKKLVLYQSRLESKFGFYIEQGKTFFGSSEYDWLNELQNDYMEIVRKYAPDYSTVTVPEDFKLDYGRRVPVELLKITIPVKFGRYNSKERIKVKDLIEFKGKIFYASTDKEYEMSVMSDIFNRVADSKYNAQWYGGSDGWREGNTMFITVANNNLKYFKHCKNAMTIDKFYGKFLFRYINRFKEEYHSKDLIYTFHNNIEDFYKSELFASVSEEWGTAMSEIKNGIAALKARRTQVWENYSEANYLKRYINVEDIEMTELQQGISNKLEDFKLLEDANSEIMNYLNLPSDHYPRINKETDARIVPDLLKKLLVL